MKFISKATNFCAVLRPGLEGNRLTGQPATPGKYIRFENGMVVIDDSREEDIKLMRAHAGFNRDFIAVEEAAADPWGAGRREKEPGHTITELKYGTPVGHMSTPVKQQLSPEMLKAVKEMAGNMAKDIIKEVLQEAKAKQEASKETEETKEIVPETTPETEQTPEVKPEVKETAPKPKKTAKPEVA